MYVYKYMYCDAYYSNVRVKYFVKYYEVADSGTYLNGVRTTSLSGFQSTHRHLDGNRLVRSDQTRTRRSGKFL